MDLLKCHGKTITLPSYGQSYGRRVKHLGVEYVGDIDFVG
jgi:hypothetical protein